jgi:hypothetical protein
MASFCALQTPVAAALGTPAASMFPDYKYLGDAPLPLRQANENWAQAQERLRTDPAVRQWVGVRRSELDDWIAHHGDRANWVAGWGHDLVDTHTGLPVHWVPIMPEPLQDGVAQKKIHGAWVMYVRQTNCNAVGDAVRLWKLTGNGRYLEWAAAQLDLYARNYSRWPVQTLNGRSQMMGQALDEATVGAVLVDAIRIIGDAVPGARRRDWSENLLAPMLANLEASNRGTNNIAVWEAATSAMIAIELGNRAAFDRALSGANGIRAMLSKGITSDYLWFEPSVAYGQYVLRALGTLFTFLSLTHQADGVRPEMLATQDMLISQARLRFADGTLSAFGDSDMGIKGLNPDVIALTQPTIPIRSGPLGLYWSTILDPTIPHSTAPVETQSQTWPASQIAMLRRGGWELFTQWGQQTASHAQGDALSYDLRFRGRAITTPAGTAAYGSGLFLNYLRTSAAHNQPIIDGQGEVRPGPGRLVSSAAWEIVARHPGFAGNANVSRSLSLQTDGAKIITTIDAGADQHRLGDIFNTTCAVSADKPVRPASLLLGQGFKWLRDGRSSGLTADWSGSLNCQGKQFGISISADSPGQVFLFRAPDNQGLLKRTAIYFDGHGSKLSVTWRITQR